MTNINYLLAISESDSLINRFNHESRKSALFNKMIREHIERNSLFDFAIKQVGRYWIWGAQQREY